MFCVSGTRRQHPFEKVLPWDIWTNSKPSITIIYTMSFQNKGYEKETELSKYVWNLKDKGEDFSVK